MTMSCLLKRSLSKILEHVFVRPINKVKLAAGSNKMGVLGLTLVY